MNEETSLEKLKLAKEMTLKKLKVVNKRLEKIEDKMRELAGARLRLSEIKRKSLKYYKEVDLRLAMLDGRFHVVEEGKSGIVKEKDYIKNMTSEQRKSLLNKLDEMKKELEGE